MAKKTNKGGNTRRRPSAGKNLIFRPGPLRQLLFVGLALGGIGIGYGAGFLLKKEQPANLPVQAPVAATTPAIITNPIAVNNIIHQLLAIRLYETNSNIATV